MNSLASLIVPAFVVILASLGCKGGDSSTKENPTDSSESNDKDGDKGPDNAENPQVGRQMAMAGTLNFGTALTDDAQVSKVLAISADGERISGTFDADSQDFTVELPTEQDKQYSIAFLDAESKVVAVFGSEELNVIGPTPDSPDSVALGDVTLGSATDGGVAQATADSAASEVRDATGLTPEGQAQLVKYDDAALAVTGNLDVDGDGKVDEKGDYSIGFSFGFTSAEGDPNANSASPSDYKNKFLPDNQVFQRGRYSLTVTVRKELLATVPDHFTIQFDEEASIDDTGTEMIIDGVTHAMGYKGVVAAGTVIRKAWQPSTDPNNQSTSFGTMFYGPIPKGKYVLKVADKVLNFNGIDVASYNSVPPVIPFIRFNVDQSEKITGIDYKWMTRSAGGDAWELATVDLIRQFVGKEGGFFSMYVMENGKRLQKRLMWSLTPEAAEGKIPLENGNKSVMQEGFGSVEEAGAMTFEHWGWNNFTFSDKLGMMVSVN